MSVGGEDNESTRDHNSGGELGEDMNSYHTWKGLFTGSF